MDRQLVRIITMLGVFVIPNTAFAYLDPGTGSALIQGLIAAIAAIGVSLKLFWHRFIAFFSGRKPTEEESSDDTPPSS